MASAIRAIPRYRVSGSFHTLFRNIEEPYRCHVGARDRMKLAPLSVSSFHTTCCTNGKRGRGDKGSKKRSSDLPILCPSCKSPFTDVEDFEGHPRFIKCLECHYFFMLVHESLKDEPIYKEERLKTPKELKEYLDKYVVGQDLAKIVLSTAVYYHYKRIRHNFIPPPKTDLAPQDANIPRTLYYPKGFKNLPKENMAELLKRHATSKPSALGPTGSINIPIDLSDVNKDDTENTDKIVIGKSNILMLGPTGSGKTLLAQTLANILDVPFAICDCTTLTSAGYVGEDIESVISKLLQNSNGNVEKCQQGIVFLDEIDKIAKAQNTQHLKDVGGEGVQQGMLKMLEGTIINVPEKNNKKMRGEAVAIDTTNILFIAAGAFSGLDKIVKRRKNIKYLGFGAPVNAKDTDLQYESPFDFHENDEENVKAHDELIKNVEDSDLIKFGLIPEFVGRMPKVCPFHSLDEDILVQILTEPQNALVKQFKHSFALDKCQLDITQDALRAIAQAAMNKKMGARGLRAELERHLLSAMYEVPGSDITQVIVSEDVIRNNEPPAFVRDIKLSDINEDIDLQTVSKQDVEISVSGTQVNTFKDSSPKV
ncbi:hypothetical protein ACF0H5_012933 [Mactra antiquata]